MSFIRSQAVSGGGFSFKYTFSDSTSSGPSAGQVRLNNNASASATQAFVSETDRNGKNMAALLDLVAANTGLLLTSEADPSRYAYYVVTGSTDNGGDRALAVTHVASNSTLTGNVMVSIAGGGGGGPSPLVLERPVQASNYTLTLDDAGLVVVMNVSTPGTLTVPSNSSVSFPLGTIVMVYSQSLAELTIAAASGVTIRNNNVTLGQYQEVSLRKRGTNEWVRAG
jgi:hypothetical protein